MRIVWKTLLKIQMKAALRLNHCKLQTQRRNSTGHLAWRKQGMAQPQIIQSIMQHIQTAPQPVQ
jgi:hypothetical protein